MILLILIVVLLLITLELTKLVADFMTLRLKLMTGITLFCMGSTILCGLIHTISKYNMWSLDPRIFTAFGLTSVPAIAGIQLIILNYKEKKVHERND